MKKNSINYLFWGMFFLYLFLLFQVVFFSRMDSIGMGLRRVNLVPFDSIQSYLYIYEMGTRKLTFNVNIWGNILMFLPLGIYVPLIRKKGSFFQTMCLLLGISVSIEVIQYLLILGSADIDDILLNVTGGFLGWLLYRLLLVFRRTPEQIKTGMTILSVVVGLPLTLLLMFLFLRN
ncbi:hypothetical protein IGI37_002308 [Enterococcus sp. AZ194]|uniref:VanZ family protein n=1 Tax=Enterococcus sp. AZ194 TaxID=2774629 RepID=UPI003F21F571